MFYNMTPGEKIQPSMTEAKMVKILLEDIMMVSLL